MVDPTALHTIVSTVKAIGSHQKISAAPLGRYHLTQIQGLHFDDWDYFETHTYLL